ncbi:hypothetical protein GCM10009765_21340 [Fodinicola feengrottensis]|uniref:Polyprenyl synthetase family protein n=1 Tax=Fodinicola feengrottensis TaxID=435914 RepID=A0ABP4SF46_9ACTN
MLPGAVAVELVHNWTLLHDDIVDADPVRRGRPTAWSLFGVNFALLAGDALLAAAYAALRDVAGESRQAADLVDETVARLIAGEARELTLADRLEVTVDDYLRVAADKSSSLVQCALGLGAILAGASSSTVHALRAAGNHLGVAWQAANDVEDIWGDLAVTGKKTRGDLRQRLRTLPVLAALGSESPAGRTLAAIWETAQRDDEFLERVSGLIEEAGGKSVAERLSRHHLSLALDHLEQANLTEEARQEIHSLFCLIVTRQSMVIEVIVPSA